jgi:alpha-ribazole phosphatase
MKIYLIRHTTPLVEKGICYGHSDLDVADSFQKEAIGIQQHLPTAIELVYSSPLQRCKKLADTLFPSTAIHTNPNLKELNCGSWEMQHWDAIPKDELQPWMNDFVNIVVPNGESYTQMHERVVQQFKIIQQATHTSSAIVTHAGVIRSILSHITHTPLKDSFTAFTIHYGCVVELNYNHSSITHQFLHNITPAQKEQHKPSQW